MRAPANQRGAVLLTGLLILLIAGMGWWLMRAANPAQQARQRDQISDAALASAKAALIGYAATTPMDKTGPTNLLCPASGIDGVAFSTGSGCAGATNQARRLGYLPWQTLSLPELRDGAGQLLWYAVSDNFRSFSAPTSTNSDTSGTLTVRDARGNILFDGRSGGGVAAVIIAPGAPLTRLTSLSQSTLMTQNPASTQARDHLDCTSTEDNADFIDASANGFIMGPVRAADGSLLVNDRLAVITRDELLAVTEKRISAEVRNCLIAAAEWNNDIFPPPAPMDAPDNLGTSGTLFGRVPLTRLHNHAEALARAITQLDAARTQVTQRTTQNKLAVIQSALRATRSASSTLSLIANAANGARTLTASALQSALNDNGIDPLAALLRADAANFSAALAATSNTATPAQLSPLITTTSAVLATLNVTYTPNTTLQATLDTQRTWAQATLAAAQAGNTSQAKSLGNTLASAQSTTLTALTAQREPLSSAHLRSRSRSLANADPATLPWAQADLIAFFNALTSQSTALQSALATTRSSLNGPVSAALIANETLAQAMDNNGDHLAASALAAGMSGAQSVIQAQLSLLATSATTALTNAISAATLANSMLSVSNQTTSNFNTLLTRMANASVAAQAIRIDGKTGKASMTWPIDPDCSWMNANSGSGWVRNQWIRHIAYQIDTPRLLRNTSGDITSGTLSVNNRGNAQVVVIAPGRALTSQTRTSALPGQFFEGTNSHPSRSGGATQPSRAFESRSLANDFNDQIAF